MRLSITLLVSLLIAGGLQPAKAVSDISADSIYKHIAVLAADSLEGREVGEEGEWKAAQYIMAVFEAAGLEPKGDSGSYFQQFEFTKRVVFGPDNRLAINGQPLEIREHFQPLPHSTNAAFEFDQIVDVGYGIVTPDSSHDDYAGLDVNGRAVLVMKPTRLHRTLPMTVTVR